jgi:hypothetical protein
MKKLSNYKNDNPQLLEYLVWVGGVYNKHFTKIEAMQDYYYWIKMGYTDVQIEEIKTTS